MACKFRAFMTTRFSTSFRRVALRCVAALALPLCAGWPAAALAERADRNKPMNIEGDQWRGDALKQTGVFIGNVVITKGTLVFRAGQVELKRTPEGYQTGVATSGNGRLASFRQKRDGVDETIEGEAQRIEYDERTSTIRLVNQAVVRRFRGTQLADETTGNVITYDSAAEVFSANGGASSGGRVRATIAPREAGPESPAPAPPAAASGAAP